MPLKGSAKHNPRFHLIVLAFGFVVGGLLSDAGRRFLPAGAVKEFLTTGVTMSLGAFNINLVSLNIGLGPIALDVSLLAIVGVFAAYLIARSMF